jgi:ActR/RegA family two-component response regulator
MVGVSFQPVKRQPVRRAGPRAPVHRARMARILVVEDHVELQRALLINLRARQYDVMVARTGREGLALAAACRRR